MVAKSGGNGLPRWKNSKILASSIGPIIFLVFVLIAGAVGGGLGTAGIFAIASGTGTRTRTARACEIVSVVFFPRFDGPIPGTGERLRYQLNNDPVPTVDRTLAATIIRRETENKQGHPQRIFPDKESANDTIRHDVVVIEATVRGAIVGVDKVYFRCFDIDDPTSNVLPVDSEIPERDNRECGFPQEGRWLPSMRSGNDLLEVDIDAQGKAFAFLEVPKQPGDSIKVGATCDTSTTGPNAKQLSDSRNVDSTPDHTLIYLYPPRTLWHSMTLPVKVTSLLTTWRRLYIERDSMDFRVLGGLARLGGNVVVGTIGPGAPAGATATVTIDQPLADTNQYVPGEMRVNRPGPGNSLPLIGRFQVTENSEGATPTVTITRPGGVPAILGGDRFTLVDDDDNLLRSRVPRDEFVMDSDIPETNVFAPAYVRPEYGALAGLSSIEVPLDVNVEDGDVRGQLASGPNAKVASSERLFWVGYLQSAFQPGVENDRDPERVNDTELALISPERGTLGDTAQAGAPRLQMALEIQAVGAGPVPGSFDVFFADGGDIQLIKELCFDTVVFLQPPHVYERITIDNYCSPGNIVAVVTPRPGQPAPTPTPGGTVTVFLENRNGSLIFHETIKEFSGGNPELERKVVAHELGHQLAGDHGDGGLMQDTTGLTTPKHLSDRSLARMRSLCFP